MKSQTKDYKMGTCCPWDRSSFPYRGLCSHNPLLEVPRGRFDLSPEQLEAIAVETKKRRLEIKRRCGKKRWNQLKQETEDPKLLEAKRRHDERSRRGQREYRKRRKEENPELFNAKRVVRKTNVRLSKKYYCTTCDIACESPSDFAKHCSGPRHLAKVARPEGTTYCTVCDITFKHPCHLRDHELRKCHLDRVAEVQSGVVKHFDCALCRFTGSPSRLARHVLTKSHLAKVAKAGETV